MAHATVDAADPAATALAIDDGALVYVGTDADPYTVEPHALSDVHVKQTWFDGRVVFER